MLPCPLSQIHKPWSTMSDGGPYDIKPSGAKLHSEKPLREDRQYATSKPPEIKIVII